MHKYATYKPPTPSYLYEKHFGRDIEECMEEITSLMGERHGKE